MERILIVNPPIPAPKPHDYLMQCNLAVYVLATDLKNKGKDVQVYDFILGTPREFESFDEIIYRSAKCGNYEKEYISKRIYWLGDYNWKFFKYLEEYKPTEIWISCVLTFYWEGAKWVYDEVKKRYPKMKIKLGGNYATLCTEHAKQHFPEAEIIVTAPDDRLRLGKIDVRFFRQLPNGFPMHTSYGCPFNCKWCAEHILCGGKMIYRDPIEVVDDIEEKAEWGFDVIKFMDSHICGNWETHFKVILKEFIRRKLYNKIRLQTVAGFHPKFVTQDKLELLGEAQIRQLPIPLETANDDRLKDNNRNVSLKEWSEAVKKVQKVKGLDIVSFALSGFPGQTIKDIYRTLNIIEQHGVHAASLMFTPVPGTDYVDDRPLEDLHPNLYPYASPEMTVEDLENVQCRYCSHRQIAPELIKGEGSLIHSGPSVDVKGVLNDSNMS